MKASPAKTIRKRLSHRLGWTLASFSLLGTSGCGTFEGMSWEERDQANQALAREQNLMYQPVRSIHDNREVPAYVSPPP